MPTPSDDAQAAPIDLTNAAPPPRKRQRRLSASAGTGGGGAGADPTRVRLHVVLLDSSTATERPSHAKVRQLTACGLGRPAGQKECLELSVFTSASDLQARLSALYPELGLNDIEFDTCYADKGKDGCSGFPLRH